MGAACNQNRFFAGQEKFRADRAAHATCAVNDKPHSGDCYVEELRRARTRLRASPLSRSLT